jgi:hypothetical protein
MRRKIFPEHKFLRQCTKHANRKEQMEHIWDIRPAGVQISGHDGRWVKVARFLRYQRLYNEKFCKIRRLRTILFDCCLSDANKRYNKKTDPQNITRVEL